MSNRNKHRNNKRPQPHSSDGNRRQGDFAVVARGVRRPDPDISQITRTSVDYFLANREFEAQQDRRTAGTREQAAPLQQMNSGRSRAARTELEGVAVEMTLEDLDGILPTPSPAAPRDRDAKERRHGAA